MQPQRPPKTVTEQLRQHSLIRSQYESSLTALQSDLVSSSPSLAGLPVLEAFQKFLENERRKTRRRIAGIMGLSAAIILVLSVVGALLAMLQVQRTETAVTGVESRMEALALESRSANQQTEDLARAALTRHETLDNAITGETDQRREGERKLVSHIRDHQNQLKTMRDNMNALQTQNERLQAELAVLLAQIARLPLQSTPSSPAAEGNVENAATKPVMSGDAAEIQQLQALRVPEPLSLRLRSGSTEAMVPWRLPMP